MNTKLDSHRLDEMDSTKLSPLDTFPKPEGLGQSPCQLQSWPQPSGSSWSSLDFPEVCSSAHKLSCCQRPLAVHFQGCVYKFWHHLSSFLSNSWQKATFLIEIYFFPKSVCSNDKDSLVSEISFELTFR